jgi:hypothetical protein
MRTRHKLLVICVATVTSFTPTPRQPPLSRQASKEPQPEDRRSFDGIDPIVGKAIAEKSKFFVAAIALAVVFEKAQHVLST